MGLSAPDRCEERIRPELSKAAQRRELPPDSNPTAIRGGRGWKRSKGCLASTRNLICVHPIFRIEINR